ncbi:MAG TPA: YihY/virulence factor BrkB family protein [Solirubrobacteraceae bacterium]|nr:YihY/virulence factor BrkB family protein [Solirubrobacteraceae bacterium]
MDLLVPVRRFDRLQRQHPPLAIPVAVLRNFSDQRAGTWAVQIAYYGFFSVFPLLLVFVSVLGFVLQDDPSLRQSVVKSALRQFPIIGSSPGRLAGSGVGLSIGLVGTLWSGLGVTLAVENAFNWVYAVGPRSQPNFFSKRLRSLKLLCVVGSLQIVSTVVVGTLSAGIGKGALVTVLGLAVGLAVNITLFFAVFRFMIPDLIPTSELWPGILLAAAGWEVLQAVGGLYAAHVVRGASETYGAFATVIGLFAWLYLGARVVVYSAEINVVLTRHLWPRSIMDPPEPADRKARAALAKMEERDDKETVDVTFHPPDKQRAPDPRRPRYRVLHHRPADDEQPAGVTGQPAGVTGQPAGVTGQPAGVTEQPAAVTGQPAGVTEQPAREPEKTADEAHPPV